MSIVLIFHDICRFEKVPIVPREFGAGFTESHEKQGNNVSCILPYRVRTHPGKPGKYWNLIIRIPGLECTGILSKVLENTGI